MLATLALSLFIALPVEAFFSSDLSPEADQPTLGLILPLTGRYAELGQQALDAALLAAGVFDRAKEAPVRILIEDSRSDPATVGEAVRRLAQAGATAIIGPLASQEAEAAATEAQQLQIPILTLTQREEITAIGEYVFRNYPTAERQIKTLVSYVRQELGHDRFAILAPNDLYGRGMSRLFREEVHRQGGEIDRERYYRTGQTDFAKEMVALGGQSPLTDEGDSAAPLKARRALGFDALFIPDAADRVALIAPQLVYYDLTGIRLLGTSAWNAPELLKTDPIHLQGALFVDGFFINSFRSEVNPFIEAFYLAYGREPAMIEALAYDAVAMTVPLLDDAGWDREAFRSNLLRLQDYPGVTGRTSFGGSRDADKALFLLTVRDGQILQIR